MVVVSPETAPTARCCCCCCCGGGGFFTASSATTTATAATTPAAALVCMTRHQIKGFRKPVVGMQTRRPGQQTTTTLSVLELELKLLGGVKILVLLLLLRPPV